jgi:hypothetical protein
MKTVLIAALTAVVVTIAALMLWPKPPAPPDPRAELMTLQKQLTDLEERIAQGPVDLTVTLTRAGARCRSQTQVSARAIRRQPVRWTINNIDCDLGGREIELRFANDDTPLDVRRPKHLRFIQAKVRGDAALRRFKYALWAVGPGGDYMLEDPELEIAF